MWWITITNRILNKDPVWNPKKRPWAYTSNQNVIWYKTVQTLPSRWKKTQQHIELSWYVWWSIHVVVVVCPEVQAILIFFLKFTSITPVPQCSVLLPNGRRKTHTDKQHAVSLRRISEEREKMERVMERERRWREWWERGLYQKAFVKTASLPPTQG